MALPLVHVDMVTGAVTCAGKLNLVLKFALEAVEIITIKKQR